MVNKMINQGCQGTFYHQEHHKNKNMNSNLLIRMMTGTIADNIQNKIKILLKHNIYFLHQNKNQMQNF